MFWYKWLCFWNIMFIGVFRSVAIDATCSPPASPPASPHIRMVFYIYILIIFHFEYCQCVFWTQMDLSLRRVRKRWLQYQEWLILLRVIKLWETIPFKIIIIWVIFIKEYWLHRQYSTLIVTLYLKILLVYKYRENCWSKHIIVIWLSKLFTS
jgi:hypothetical protein